MLKNQVVMITGAGRGIGRSIAIACAQQGAKLFLIARTLSEIKETAREIIQKYDVPIVSKSCDVTQLDLLEQTVQEAETRLGPMSALVAAAGVYGPIGPIDETSPEDWRRAIEINLVGTYYSIYCTVKGMKKRNAGRILLLSGGGQGPLPHFSSYLASKGAIWRLTETLGAELAPFGISVNAIAPGAVNTRFLDELLQAGESRVGKDFYEKALQQKKEGGTPPEKAAELALYLLSDRSKGLYGKILSAVWDPYEKFPHPEELSKSDIYTMKRVLDLHGNTHSR